MRRPGFEPGSPAWKAGVLGHWTNTAQLQNVASSVMAFGFEASAILCKIELGGYFLKYTF